MGLQFGLLVLLVLKPEGNLLFEAVDFSVFSMVFYIAGFSILMVAFFNLRPSLRVSPIPIPGAPLIVIGIYKYFRHPMYLGVLLIGLGIAMVKLDIFSIIIWMGLFITLSVKASFEDMLLRQSHSSAREYQSKTLGLPRLRNA